MRARRWWLPLFALWLSLSPFAPRPALADDLEAESRVGVALMVVCGASLKAALVAPVPWAGIAAVSCLFGLLDAAASPDP